jgi:alpha-mannosidase
MDQGLHDVRLQLLPHAGPWTGANVVRRSWELNEPAFTHVESGHRGDLPAAESFLQCKDERAALTVLKKSEEADDLILRGYETTGAAFETKLEWPHWKQDEHLPLSAHEIQTRRVRVPDFRSTVVNMLEEPFGNDH